MKRRNDHVAHPSQLAEAAISRRVATISDAEPPTNYSRHLIKSIQNRMASKYIQQFDLPFIHNVQCYEKLMKIGQGTFGEVFKARCKKTGRLVALKKILMENEREGFPITAIREVKMLQRLRKTYITELIEICNTKGTTNADKSTFYLVFTFCDFDLAGLLSRKDLMLELGDVKTMMKHLLNGLHCLHASSILHRDMKTANVLVTGDGVLKLADFGLSRQMIKSGKPQNYTNRVVTLWYRPPELLLGSKRYGPAIDMWGVGAIMAEMWTKAPILQGSTEQMQLELIQTMCGGISPKTWPGVEHLPFYGRLTLKPHLPRTLREKIGTWERDESALQLLDSLLTLNPNERATADKALQSKFLWSEPMPKENIAHVVKKLPSNIFEFTAGRGAHAGRRLNPQGASNAPPNVAAMPNGVNRIRPPARHVHDTGQLHDITY